MAFSEKISFNFLEHLTTFTENEHSKLQGKLFLELIAFKDEKAKRQEHMYSDDFDMVINSLSGNDIKKIIKKFPMNFYEYQDDSIEGEDNYSIMGETKKDFYEEKKKMTIPKYAKNLRIIIY